MSDLRCGLFTPYGHRSVRFFYETQPGTFEIASARPLTLSQNGSGVWFVLASEKDQPGMRCFFLSRIRLADPVSEPAPGMTLLRKKKGKAEENRTVVCLSNGRVTYTTTGFSTGGKTIALKTWKRWAAKAVRAWWYGE